MPIDGESALAKAWTWTTVSRGSQAASSRASARLAAPFQIAWAAKASLLRVVAMSSCPRQTTRMPAGSSRGSTGPTAANRLTRTPRAASPRADSIATLAWPPLIEAWSATRTTCTVVFPRLRSGTKTCNRWRLIPRKPVFAIIPAAETGAISMHVVILAEFASASGGAEKVALESARGLAEAGVAVTYLQAIPGAADPLLAHGNIRRVVLGLPDIWSLGGARAAAAGIWHAEAARTLAAALAALPERPDCIHLHQWTRALSPAVFPVLSGAGVPLVVTLHDYALACPNGVYYRFDRAEPCGLTPLSAACIVAPCDARSRAHKLVRVARTVALRQAVKGRPLHVVHVCDASRRRMGDLLGGTAVTHHRIDNPVRIADGPAAAPERGDAIAYVGRLTREKGADLVADAARAAGLPALFIGAGPLEAELRARDGVEVIGWQSPTRSGRSCAAAPGRSPRRHAGTRPGRSPSTRPWRPGSRWWPPTGPGPPRRSGMGRPASWSPRRPGPLRRPSRPCGTGHASGTSAPGPTPRPGRRR